MWPSRVTRGVYYLTMTASNALGGYLAYVLCGYPLPLAFRAIYAGAAAVLVLLRQGALFLDVQTVLADRRRMVKEHAPAVAHGSAGDSAKDASSVKTSPPSQPSSCSPATKARGAAPAHPPGLGLTPENGRAVAQTPSPALESTSMRSMKYPPGLGYTPRQHERAAKSPARTTQSPARAVAALKGSGLNGKVWGGTATARRKSQAPDRFA